MERVHFAVDDPIRQRSRMHHSVSHSTIGDDFKDSEHLQDDEDWLPELNNHNSSSESGQTTAHQRTISQSTIDNVEEAKPIDNHKFNEEIPEISTDGILNYIDE
jgi:hypothetical protein